MAKTKYWLPKFDPDAAYVVAAWPIGHTVSGFQPKPGQAFDKTSVSPRILEELYVKRWVAVAQPAHVTPLPPQPPIGDDAEDIDDADGPDGSLPGLSPAQQHLSRRQRKKLRRAAA